MLSIDVVWESVHGDHDCWSFQSFESSYRAVEDVVGVPEVLPVGVFALGELFGVDGVTALGGE